MLRYLWSVVRIFARVFGFANVASFKRQVGWVDEIKIEINIKEVHLNLIMRSEKIQWRYQVAFEHGPQANGLSGAEA